MGYRIENLDTKHLIKAFRRLKKSTKGFSLLIVREPLDYTDFELELTSNVNNIVYEIQDNQYKPDYPYMHLSAKSKGINRPTVVLGIKDALIYRFCIEQIEDDLLGEIKRNRIRGGIKITANVNPDADEDYYEKWFKDWQQHQDNLEESLNRKEYLVATDIASYFENINILVLKDAIRSDIEGRRTIINLLFYLLENIHTRYEYEVNTYNGLPQEGIDCSRILAYYFLHSHDDIMGEFCREHDAEYYRFVDDMSITVNDESTGRNALKTITESLRRLNLVSSIEKTSIIDSDRAKEELFFEENRQLSSLNDRIIKKLKKNESIDNEILNIQNYYEDLKKKKKESYGNWIKILKRFYTTSMFAKSDFIIQEFPTHIIKYPFLFSDKRIGKYLLRIRNSSNFNKAITNLINYLYSDENLYPALESNLIETILLIPEDYFDETTKDELKKLGSNILFKRNDYSPLSDYARALSCLLVHKLDKSTIDIIARHYTKSTENDSLLRKYLFFVSLTSKNQNLRQKALDKAKKDHDYSMQRLVNLIENIDRHKNKPLVKKYVDHNEIYIYYDSDDKFEIKEKYSNVRGSVLKELIDIYQKT